jgi:hypothetical protein
LNPVNAHLCSEKADKSTISTLVPHVPTFLVL